MDKKKIIITTSWDDGNASDLRLAELLHKYNFEGTFYVPIRNAEHSVMSSSDLRVVANEFEIGGHTVNHIYLNTLEKTDAKYEVLGCKTMLQDLLGRSIDAFCYPGGKYSQRDIDLVKEAGFLFGRTTRLLHTTFKHESLLMDTSVQAYHHTSATLTKHCLKNRFVFPIVQQLFFCRVNRNFPRLAESLLNRVLNNEGVFHLWGHSWEIDQFQLWDDLETVLRMLAFNQNVEYVNNTECWNIMAANRLSDSQPI